MNPSPADGETVKRLRAERCWTRAKLSEESGISYRTLTRIENGEEAWQVGPRSDLLHRLAAALEVSVADFAPIDRADVA